MKKCKQLPDPTELEEVLMRRDGLSRDEAYELLTEARDAVTDGQDPEDVLQDFFGLEPDYVFDLLDLYDYDQP